MKAFGHSNAARLARVRWLIAKDIPRQYRAASDPAAFLRELAPRMRKAGLFSENTVRCDYGLRRLVEEAAEAVAR